MPFQRAALLRLQRLHLLRCISFTIDGKAKIEYLDFRKVNPKLKQQHIFFFFFCCVLPIYSELLNVDFYIWKFPCHNRKKK